MLAVSDVKDDDDEDDDDDDGDGIDDGDCSPSGGKVTSKTIMTMMMSAGAIWQEPT